MSAPVQTYNLSMSGPDVGNFPGNFGSSYTTVMSDSTNNLFEAVQDPRGSGDLQPGNRQDPKLQR